MTDYRWGIIGTGYAADQFVSGLSRLDRVKLTAVASRTQSRCDSFADRHSIAERFDSYQHLIESSSVDVVYIAAVAPLHHELCLAAIDAGKPVLCEKPLAMNSVEASEIAEAARENGVFCMEAMWSRFIPLSRRIQQMVADGTIGEIVHISADFGLRQTPQSNPRLFDLESGGAMRDLGVYPVSLAVQYLGRPRDVRASLFGDQGEVDCRCSGVVEFEQEKTAAFLASITCQTPTIATFIGTEGFIEVQSPMYCPTKARLVRSSAPETAGLGRWQRITAKLKRKWLSHGSSIQSGCQGNGYHYQAEEVMSCLDRGQRQSRTMPLEESVWVMQVVDAALSGRQDQQRRHDQSWIDVDNTSGLTESTMEVGNQRSGELPLPR